MLGFLCSCKRFCALSVLFPFRSFARCFEKTNSSRDRPRSSVFGCFSIDWTSFRAPQAAPKSNWPWWLASKHDPTSPEVEARHAGEGGRGTERRRVFRFVSPRFAAFRRDFSCLWQPIRPKIMSRRVNFLALALLASALRLGASFLLHRSIIMSYSAFMDGDGIDSGIFKHRYTVTHTITVYKSIEYNVTHVIYYIEPY